MSDAAQLTINEVRAAAEAVKAAIDRHLEAVAGTTEEGDPAVVAAYEDLAAAAITYDQLLYEVYDEVTGQGFWWGERPYVRLDPYTEPAHVLTVRTPS